MTTSLKDATLLHACTVVANILDKVQSQRGEPVVFCLMTWPKGMPEKAELSAEHGTSKAEIRIAMERFLEDFDIELPHELKPQ